MGNPSLKTIETFLSFYLPVQELRLITVLVSLFFFFILINSQTGGIHWPSNVTFPFFFFKYLFIWLLWVLVVACGVFDLSCWHVGSSFLIRKLVSTVIKPEPPALGTLSPSHWTGREVLSFLFKLKKDYIANLAVENFWR